jgi:cell division protein FtsI (penicillin-binding protein 3)
VYQRKGGAKVGIEGAYDSDLKGERGVGLMQRIAGNYWRPVKDANTVEPRNGYDILTTIDVNFQDVAYHALYTQLSKHSASHGTAVLMEVKTGDVKAIVNLKQDSYGFYGERYNYAVGERTEPGSTFKLPSLMVALEDGYIDLNDSIDTGNGKVYFHDHLIRDSHEGGYGKITVKKIFEVSSNVGMSKIITRYYTGNEERFVKGLKRMGLTEKLDIEIKGERKPYIKFPNDTLWSGISLPQMSYGYEVEQTPLQILSFYNAVANDGKMMKPRFVKAVADHGDIVREIKPEVINPSICSKTTIDKAKIMLKGVVEEGTAQNLKNSNYKIAGKTGTCQIANTKYGYRSKNKMSYQASFVGYFPADNPIYSCIVVVNAPTSGVYYGNTVAGQVFKEIADKVYSTQIDLYGNDTYVENKSLNIPYSRKGYKKDLETILNELNIPYEETGVNSDWVATEKQDSAIQFYNRYIKDNVVPNVKGMGAKDALFVLENLGLNVIIEGRGVVGEQSLPSGTRFKQGDRVILKLI